MGSHAGVPMNPPPLDTLQKLERSERDVKALPDAEDFVFVKAEQLLRIIYYILDEMDVFGNGAVIMIRWSCLTSSNPIRIDHDLITAISLLTKLGIQLEERADAAGAVETKYDCIWLPGVIGTREVEGVAAVFVATLEKAILCDTGKERLIATSRAEALFDMILRYRVNGAKENREKEQGGSNFRHIERR